MYFHWLDKWHGGLFHYWVILKISTSKALKCQIHWNLAIYHMSWRKLAWFTRLVWQINFYWSWLIIRNSGCIFIISLTKLPNILRRDFPAVPQLTEEKHLISKEIMRQRLFPKTHLLQNFDLKIDWKINAILVMGIARWCPCELFFFLHKPPLWPKWISAFVLAAQLTYETTVGVMQQTSCWDLTALCYDLPPCFFGILIQIWSENIAYYNIFSKYE